MSILRKSRPAWSHCLMELLQLRLELLRRHHDGTPSVADRNRVRNRAIVAAPDSSRADDDRRIRLLRGLGITSHRRELDELALVARLGLGPQLLHRADIVARHRPALLELDAHDFGFIAQPSGADAEQKTSAGKMIDGGNFLRAYDGIALGHQADAGAEFDLAGHRARDPQAYERIDDVGIGFGNFPSRLPGYGVLCVTGIIACSGSQKDS